MARRSGRLAGCNESWGDDGSYQDSNRCRELKEENFRFLGCDCEVVSTKCSVNKWNIGRLTLEDHSERWCVPILFKSSSSCLTVTSIHDDYILTLESMYHQLLTSVRFSGMLNGIVLASKLLVELTTCVVLSEVLSLLSFSSWLFIFQTLVTLRSVFWYIDWLRLPTNKLQLHIVVFISDNKSCLIYYVLYLNFMHH